MSVALRSLPRGFYRRDATEVAPDLLNKVIVHGGRSARIVEVEAYRGVDDPGSHAYRGATARNATMFGPPGRLYVYFSYGMHWCANAVCGEDGEAMAVLLRAAAPLSGLDEMRMWRARARRDRDLCNGPAKLCQALGLDRTHDGADLVTSDRCVRIVADTTAPPGKPALGARIGLSAGTDLLLRWCVPGDPNLSRPAPSPADPTPHPSRPERGVTG